MKRDLNLIRSIMLKSESSAGPTLPSDFIIDATLDVGAGHSDLRFISNQFKLMNDAKLASFSVFSDGQVALSRLTSHGHDVLNQIRDDDKWASIQQYLDVCSFDVILEILNKTPLVEFVRHGDMWLADPVILPNKLQAKTDGDSQGTTWWEKPNTHLDQLRWNMTDDERYAYQQEAFKDIASNPTIPTEQSKEGYDKFRKDAAKPLEDRDLLPWISEEEERVISEIAVASSAVNRLQAYLTSMFLAGMINRAELNKTNASIQEWRISK